MIHYHGLPITPDAACVEALRAGHGFVSFARPEQLWIAVDVAQSFAVDNGAFSAWRSGRAVDWSDYYAWVEDTMRAPSFDFAVIPDVIDGDEAANDALIDEWPWQRERHIGAPVWHLHESLDRLIYLASEWPRVCLGSSGAYAHIGTERWWARMADAFDAVCTSDRGLPLTKLHGLRMLAPEVVESFPFSSADSTNIGQNIGLDGRWNGTYSPANKAARVSVLRGRIESFNAPARWNRAAMRRPLDRPLFTEVHP
jgi:hypothetical protein